MRPSVITQAATGTSAWFPVNYRADPFNAGFGCVITGSPTYTVEHTFDDVFDPTVTPTAFPHATVAGATANQNSNYAFPIRAIRLSVTAGTGSVSLTWLQGATT
jgi:hypothetical protein